MEETPRELAFNEQGTATLRRRDDYVIRIRWGLREGEGASPGSKRSKKTLWDKISGGGDKIINGFLHKS